MTTKELTPNNTPTEYTLETLPELLPQQAKMLEYIIQGDNYTDAYRKAGYICQAASQGAWQLATRNPLKAHIDYYLGKVSKTITKDWKQGKLKQLVDIATNTNNETINGDLAIKAIAELNKMQGDYAPDKLQVNSVNQSVEDVRNALKEYKSEY